MEKKAVFSAIIILLLLLGAFIATQRRTKEEKPIKVGMILALGTITPKIAEFKGSFEQAGLNVEIIVYPDGPTLMEAFSGEEIQIALLGIVPSTKWFASGIDLKVVAGANGGGHVLIARADSGIETVNDLKGKSVCTPRIGSVTHTLYSTLLTKVVANPPLDWQKDIDTRVGIAPADMPQLVFVSKEFDAMMTWEPFASQAEINYPGKYVIVFDVAQWWRENHEGRIYPVNVVVARTSFIENHPDLLRKFLEVYIDTVDWINENPKEANELIAQIMNLDVSIVESARRRIEFNYNVNVQDCYEILQFAKQLGIIEELPEEDELFDLSFIKG